MLDRMLSFLGACGLLLAVTATMPIEPALASSRNCTSGTPGCVGDPVAGVTGTGFCATEQDPNACTGDSGCGGASVGDGVNHADCKCQ